MTTIIRDVTMLHPKMESIVMRLHKYLIDAHETGRTKTRFEIFETYRSPDRQAHLLKKGSTKAGKFQSAHQFGLAVDFVPFLTDDEAIRLGRETGSGVLPGWNWHAANDYRFLAASAQTFGLTAPIGWDPCHIQHPIFLKVRGELRKIEA